MDQHQVVDVEGGRLQVTHGQAHQQAHCLVRRVCNSLLHPRSPLQSQSPISSIPRTSPERLALASPDKHDAAASTALYLAYGSNLSSETFLHVRGIRPVSQINVSAPAFDLAFDLPGLPYWEPCFSNVTPRKIPKPPIPGDPPKNPFPPPPSSSLLYSTGIGAEEKDAEPAREEGNDTASTLLPSLPPGVPTWSKGLYGVVYEVTQEDYRTIIQTEGTAYHDVLTPCLALPPPLNIPEKPPIPELPRPFVAHTLYAPRLPGVPDDGDDDDDDRPKPDNRWWRKLLLPVRRPESGYAQPSARYLGLIRAGAHEHYLPDDYRAYLARLQPYRATTWRQEVGRWLMLLLAAPLVALTVALGRVFARDDGSAPPWLAAASALLMNLIWIAYDKVFKPLFGDGERTIEDDDDGGDNSSAGWRRRGEGARSIYGHRHGYAWGDEKNALLGDW
ncbi:hypothetical protein GGR52DRAFT_326697 [Hypoxylon sp. FL1284]|nr:hypothetical protein GGR52DRAFT_326697 [Hypoxylon sp. FL1284]